MNSLHKLITKTSDIKVSVLFLFVTAFLVFAAIWAWNDYLHSPPFVDDETYPVRGIDVSAHNGMMNLSAAADDGIEFIFIKASEGKDFKDSNFRLNYEKAEHAGLKIGAYHFFRFDTDGVLQARNLLQAIGNKHLDLGVAVDVEQHGNPENIPNDSITERLTAMSDYLNMKGYRVTFYSNNDGFYNFLAENFKGYPLWICSFSKTPINEDWTFWQYYHSGHVKGIRGKVDLNAFNGSRKQWEDFLKSQPHPENGPNN